MSLDNIDRYIRDLNAIKNYDFILDQLEKTAAKLVVQLSLTKELEASADNLVKTNTQIKEESKRKDLELKERDKKIEELEQRITFLRAVLGKDIKEDDKEMPNDHP